MAFFFKYLGIEKISRKDFSKLPLIIRAVLFFSLVAIGVKVQVLGFNMSGIAWIIPFLISLYVIAKRFKKITFPFFYWLPWILLLVVNLFFVDYASIDPRVVPLQRTLQIFTPLSIGMAVSSYRPSIALIRVFFNSLRIFAFFLFVVEFVLGSLTSFAAFAAENMMALLLCVFFANRYLMFKEIKDLQIWSILVCLPVLSVTRMVIGNTLMTFPLALARASLIRRLTFVVIIAIAGFVIFHLPQVQQKMFFSGQGELSDIGNNDDLQTSGRKAMWEVLYEEAQRKHWFGHSTGAGETLTYSFTPVGYPHNDWLLTYYDYGAVGVCILGLCILLTLMHGLNNRRKVRDKNILLLFNAGLSAYIPFIIVMYSDNILVYASFFGMLHYTILGMGYAALKAERDNQLLNRIQINNSDLK